MSIAIDTNVLVRLLVRDDEEQYLAALRLLEQAEASGEPILIMLCALLETEWVLRSRYKLDRADIAASFMRLLESGDIEFEHEPTVEETLYLWARYPRADFADCLLAARAAQLGQSRFMTFDADAAELPRGELLQ